MRSRRQFLAQSAAASLATAASRSLFAAAEPARRALAHDPLRPQFHLLPAGNWMNDPNGPIVWNGKTHLFYQLNPVGVVSNRIHWGHSVSSDLVHWQHLPVALSPTPDSPDQDGCWSGSCIEHEGRCFAFYTGVQVVPRDQATCKGDTSYRETQNLAIASSPDLRSFQKQAAPVLPTPPPGLNVTGFRDPAPWRDSDGTWYLCVGSGIAGKAGAILLYRGSPDLLSWEYLHPLFEGASIGKNTADPVDSGTMFECPDFFKLDGHYVLFFSTERKVHWLVGTLDRPTLRFTPTARGLLDTGAFYAPKSMRDTNRRRILWGWVTETRPQAEFVRAGWAGVMALPRILNVSSAGQLTMSLPASFDAILGPPQPCRPAITLPSLAAKVTATLTPGTGFKLTVGPASAPIDLATLQASADGGHLTVNGTTLDHIAADKLTLFADGSVFELFLGTRIAHTFRAYPQLAPNPSLTITAIGSPADLTAQAIQPISKDRLTT